MSSRLIPTLIITALLAGVPASAGDALPACTGKGCHEISARDAGHDPFRSGSCPSCHLPGPSFTPGSHDGGSFAPAPQPSAVCPTCHDEPPYAGAETRGHGGGGATCLDCHLPHESPFPYLLRGPYPSASYAPFRLETYGICWKCHEHALATVRMTEATGFRQGRRNFHYSHLHKRKGMSCRLCHDPHMDERPFLIRGTLARSDAGWRGEMRFLPSSVGGSCVGGCHRDLSYRR